MAMAPTVKLVLGCIAFAIFWILAVFPEVPILPVGRTAGSLLGAMLMVIFKVITPDEAYESIDLPILGFLFGTMVVSIYLEKADMFKYLGKLLTWKSRGTKDLICRICLISAVSSALFTNDTSCVVLTEFVLKIARQHNLPPYPFLLALASSANIGSAATPIGNPQNLVIAVQSRISFGEFLFGIFPSMVLGVVVNAVIILCMYWEVLSVQKDPEDATSEVVSDEDVNSHQFSPATMSHLNSFDGDSINQRSLNSSNEANLRNRAPFVETDIHQAVDSNSINEPGNRLSLSLDTSIDMTLRKIDTSIASDNEETYIKGWRRLLWKSSVYLVTLGMLVSLLMGLNMSWTAITAALALVVLDFKDARPCLEKVFFHSVFLIKL